MIGDGILEASSGSFFAKRTGLKRIVALKQADTVIQLVYEEARIDKDIFFFVVLHSNYIMQITETWLRNEQDLRMTSFIISGYLFFIIFTGLY